MNAPAFYTRRLTAFTYSFVGDRHRPHGERVLVHWEIAHLEVAGACPEWAKLIADSINLLQQLCD